MKKILLAGFAALAATALFAHDMPVVEKFTFDYDKLWTDTTDCMETPASMRMRQPIARWKGKPVERQTGGIQSRFLLSRIHSVGMRQRPHH